MNILFTPRAWYEYTDWQLEDKKTLKRINQLIRDAQELVIFQCKTHYE